MFVSPIQGKPRQAQTSAPENPWHCQHKRQVQRSRREGEREKEMIKIAGDAGIICQAEADGERE